MRLYASGEVKDLKRGHRLGYVGRLSDGRVIVITRASVAPTQSRNFVFLRSVHRHWKSIKVTGNGGHGINAADGTHYATVETSLGKLEINVRAEGGGWKTKGKKKDMGSRLADQPVTALWIPDNPSDSGI